MEEQFEAVGQYNKVIESEIEVNERTNDFKIEDKITPPEKPKTIDNTTPDFFKYYVDKYQPAYAFEDVFRREICNLLFGLLIEVKELKEAIQKK